MNILLVSLPTTPGKLCQDFLDQHSSDQVARYEFIGDGSKGVMAIIHELRQHTYDEVFVAVNDIDQVTRLTFLKIFSVIPKARHHTIIDTRDRQLRVSRASILLRDLPLLVVEYVQGYFAKHHIEGLVRKLERDVARASIQSHEIKKIAYFRTDLWIGTKAGGSVGHIAGVANAFVHLGHKLFFVSSDKLELIDEQKTPITVVPPTKKFNNLLELPILTYNETFTPAARQMLAQQAPDCIYQRYSVKNFSGVQLSREFNIPLIIEYNGSEVWIAKNWGKPLRYQALAERIEMLNLRAADIIVVVSDVMRDELVERGIPIEKIVSYPNGIDPERFDPAKVAPLAVKRRQALELESKIVIGFISTFSQWHGPLVLADSIAQIVKSTSQPVHFLLIGDGPLRNQTQQIIERSGMTSHVTMLGLVPQADAPEYLMACDIFVSPHVPNPDGTKFFGSPTKLFEYMALGKGIVASDLDQIGQVLSHEQTAILTTPGDVASFSAGVLRLVNDPGLRQRLGENARRESLAKYTWNENVRQVLRRFEQVSH